MVPVLHSMASVGHLAAVGLALLAGTYVLASPKGSRRHRRAGWLYVGSMVAVLYTAFQLYFLFGRFGIVHWGAVGSGLALLVGTGAAVGRAVVPAWRQWHYLGMGASVTGLYTALVVESTYRFFPAAYFWWSTLGLASLVLLAGSGLLYRHYPRPRRARRPVGTPSRARRPPRATFAP